jgi:hypothetical protein
MMEKSSREMEAVINYNVIKRSGAMTRAIMDAIALGLLWLLVTFRFGS